MSSPNRRYRKSKDLKRRKASKDPRKTILIVCEGEKTEPNYFRFLTKRLDLSSVNIEICGKECGPAPISVVDYALLKKEAVPRSNIIDKYDLIWCVIDVENPHTNVSLSQALDKAKGNNLKVALSNPCFEYWYLLHFKKTSSLMQNCDDVIKILKKYLPSYDKADKSIFNTIFEKMQDAIKNSRDVIKEKCFNREIKDCNSSTNVHEIVEDILDYVNQT